MFFFWNRRMYQSMAYIANGQVCRISSFWVCFFFGGGGFFDCLNQNSQNFKKETGSGREQLWGMGPGGSELGRSQQQALAGKMASSIWGCISRSTTRRSKKNFIPLYLALTHTMSSLGPSNTGKTSTCCSKLSGKAPRQTGWNSCPMRRGWESVACTAWCRDGFGAPHSHPPNVGR